MCAEKRGRNFCRVHVRWSRSCWCLDEIRSEPGSVWKRAEFFSRAGLCPTSALCFSLVRPGLRNFVPTAMVNAFSLVLGSKRDEGERERWRSFLFSLRRQANDRPSRAVWMKPPPSGEKREREREGEEAGVAVVTCPLTRFHFLPTRRRGGVGGGGVRAGQHRARFSLQFSSRSSMAGRLEVTP